MVCNQEAFSSYFAPLELVEFTPIEGVGKGWLISVPSPELVRPELCGYGCYWFRTPNQTC